MSQKPARQRPLQQSAAVVQEMPDGWHAGAPPPVAPSAAGGSGASHEPFVQLAAQQSAPVVQAPPLGVHAIPHVFVPGSQ